MAGENWWNAFSVTRYQNQRRFGGLLGIVFGEADPPLRRFGEAPLPAFFATRS